MEAMADVTTKLNLPDLRKGVDSFELRIWCPMSAYMQNIITIRYINSYWDLTETMVWESYPDREYKKNDTANHLTDVVVDSTKSRPLLSKSDKKKFIDSLMNNFVMNFPKRSEIQGSFEIGYDSYRYIFEIAEKDKYQMLEYACGGSIVDKAKVHDKIRDFLNFIRRQLNGEIPDCN
jgi:hypothetical protein